MIGVEQSVGLAVAAVVVVLGLLVWIGVREIAARSKRWEPLSRQRVRMAARYPMIHVVFPEQEDRDLYDQDKDMSIHGPFQN